LVETLPAQQRDENRSEDALKVDAGEEGGDAADTLRH